MTLPNQKDEPKSTVTKESMLVKSNLKGDWPNIFLLLLLYIMQGIPLGIVTVIPMLLQSKQNVTYKEQALFSIVVWPFSLKLLWAPLVDALYIQKIGRRKSWLIPVQFLMGMYILFLYYIFSTKNIESVSL
ncbi:acetyl-coenzyme A transporter 1-like [Acyrthosiphon pisum]|uniref:Acetyl-coenzyme A transporter 1 n=1 Tax=Acyrthosiphon pisum TaxID=7029 RepID=A0A8R2D5R1_ACYPI|nr:acetyl-coenzyme A transporter 1-like [Acyrthosiphon pisum]|eukprot:XP_016661824.1 PREDICTED: acetyl-coenzyme A transporter 1-like [Acyrthosiphon pisum]